MPRVALSPRERIKLGVPNRESRKENFSSYKGT